jgi:hypothetical protein
MYVIGTVNAPRRDDRSRHPTLADGKLYTLGMIGIEREDNP